MRRMPMRWMCVWSVCALALCFGAVTRAQSVTVTGEIVDQACYNKDKSNTGADHKDCGLGCAKKGMPLAIVTKDGEVYQIVGAYTENKNAKLIDVFAETVEATGTVTEKDGKKLLDVQTLKKAS